jgi:predicted Zn finger-like uncharacterized protein
LLLGQKIFVILIVSIASLTFIISFESVVILTGIILIASTVCCCFDVSYPTPEIPKPKPWGPKIYTQTPEGQETKAEPFITVVCPSCGTEHMVTSPEYRPDAPHLIECNKCGEIFSII